MKIVLKPIDPQFEPIGLTPKDEVDVRVMAELVSVLAVKRDTSGPERR